MWMNPSLEPTIGSINAWESGMIEGFKKPPAELQVGVSLANHRSTVHFRACRKLVDEVVSEVFLVAGRYDACEG